MFAVQVDRVVEAWRKLLEGVAAPARLVKRAEEERRKEREEEEEEEMKRKTQEKKSVCSECEEEQSNNRDQHHDVVLASTVGPSLGKMVGTGSNKQESGGHRAGEVLLPSSSSEATRHEVGTTTPTTTEVNYPLLKRL